MWKSGWNLDKEWVKRNEKWLILLVLGLANFDLICAVWEEDE